MTWCTECIAFHSHKSIFFFKNFGNCSIVPINKDLAGDLNVADGRIQSPDPMHVFFMDQKFAYNGIVSFWIFENLALYNVNFSMRKEE